MENLEGISTQIRYLVDVIVLDINFDVRTLFAVLRHIFIYSYLRQKSLLKLWKYLLYTHQWGVSYTARIQQRLLALLEKNISNIISPNVFLAKFINLITVHQYRQHRHKFGNS